MPGLALIGIGALGWLLGEVASVAVARQAGLILMLQGAVLTCLGREVARGLLFPLGYALFLIPVGAELVPAMQTLTASMVTGLLALTGVPAHLEGVFITTPVGYFEVAEACAGVRFLVAMAAFGALVANVCFKSGRGGSRSCRLSDRADLANAVRAWATIYVAEQSGSVDFAASFDHVIYGWLFSLSSSRDPRGRLAVLRSRRGRTWLADAAPGGRRSAPLSVVVALALAIAAFPLAWSQAIAFGGAQAAPAEITMPNVAGWSQVEPHGGSRLWTPHFAGADLLRVARYRDAAGREVDLAIAVFARQEEGRELVSFGQGATGPDSDWSWSADAPAPPNGRAERIASHGLVREVWSFYRVGQVLTGSRTGVRLETMRVRLLGGPQRRWRCCSPRPSRPPAPRRARRSMPSWPRSGRSTSSPTAPREPNRCAGLPVSSMSTCPSRSIRRGSRR